MEAKKIDDTVKASIDRLLHQTFKPEFINRIDAVVYFHRLDESIIENIAKIQINQLQERLQEKHIKLTVTPEALKEIAHRGYSQEFGARPLKRAIQNYLMIPISQVLLKNPDIHSLTVAVKDGEFIVK